VRRGVKGLVTDGAVRDIVGVEQSGLPVWSRGTASPAPGNALTFIDWGLPIACGGVVIFPGDVIVADRDGAVVIPQAMVDEVAAEAAEIERFDAWVIRQVSEGQPLPGLYPPNAENLARYKQETGGASS
jgi:regulator of RNase E activity RraA